MSDDNFVDEESNFNDSELQDIMSEIEDLEKDFDTESVLDTEEGVTTEMTLQEKIDAELQKEFETTKKTQANLTAAKPVLAEIHEISSEKNHKVTPSHSPSGPSEVAFEACGQMILNLDFKVGDKKAKLCINPDDGLKISFPGVELVINEENGCTFLMDNGMKFTIPLSSEVKTNKNKAA